jgi:uncharacterized protein (DUF2147 family)
MHDRKNTPRSRRLTAPSALAGALALLAAVPALALPPASPQSSWLTDDRKGVVEIAPCGERLCGRIARVLDKGPGVPRTDVNNPDPRLRSRPLIGLVTLSGFARRGDEWEGRAYDPKSGKSYRSTLRVQPDGSLKVTGCVLFICESRRWTRVP